MTVGGDVRHSDHPVPGHPGPDSLSSPRIALDAAALPLQDQLVMVAPDGTVAVLNASARRLWEALRAGCTVDDLIEASVREGNLPKRMARTNIARALASWQALGLIDAAVPDAEPAPRTLPAPARPRRAGCTLELDAVYQPGDHPVRVRCDDRVLAEVIEAACGSCRVGDDADPQASVDVIGQDGWFAVEAEEAALARADDPTQNRALARHRCLTALLETARPSRRWLGILHASAVSADGRCVVFCAAKGSGKSTLAAALVASGAAFVTDDYAPLEQSSWRVWPVPYAPGIKRGSWRCLSRSYPDLYVRAVHKLAGLQIRYLDLDGACMAPLDRGLPVAALVFPRYKAGATLEQRRMSATEAFAALCHARSMLDRRPEVLEETLRFVARTPAYRLVYGDLDRAIEWVRSLWRTA